MIPDLMFDSCKWHIVIDIDYIYQYMFYPEIERRVGWFYGISNEGMLKVGNRYIREGKDYESHR